MIILFDFSRQKPEKGGGRGKGGGWAVRWTAIIFCVSFVCVCVCADVFSVDPSSSIGGVPLT